MPGFNREAIEELFRFNGYTWENIVSELRKLGEETFTKPAPGSGWPSFRECLAHNLFGYARWLAIMKGAPMQGDYPAGVTSLDDVTGAYERFRREFRALLDGADDAELHRLRDFMVDDDPIQYSLSELLVHLLLHERGHLGDINTLFFQLGIDADVDIEYRFMLGRHPN